MPVFPFGELVPDESCVGHWVEGAWLSQFGRKRTDVTPGAGTHSEFHIGQKPLVLHPGLYP